MRLLFISILMLLYTIVLGQKKPSDNFYFNHYEIYASSPKYAVFLGEAFELELVLNLPIPSHFSYTLTVNGENQQFSDRRLLWKKLATKEGLDSVDICLEIWNPKTSKGIKLTKKVGYEVGRIMGTISADKNNILYMAIPNPISVAVNFISSNDLELRISGDEKADIERIGKTHNYRITPHRMTKKRKELEIELWDKRKNEKITFYRFRVKRIPDPIAKLANGKTNGLVSAREMQVMPGLMAVFENFDFDVRCNVESFIVEYRPKVGESIQIKHKGGRFKGEILDWIRVAQPGDQYLFSDVQARCPGDERARYLNNLAFLIR